MSSTTLTSLAMLKLTVDQGHDYLDYLRPFIVQILVDHRPNPVTDGVVRTHIRNDYGLEIPERAVQVVLKRLSRSFPLKRDAGVYRINGEFPDPGIAAAKSIADRHIDAVVSDFLEFSRDTARPLSTRDDAVQVVCQFLSEFDIPCLRAYLRGTAIPTIEDKLGEGAVLVSKYLLDLQERNPERFDSFMIMAQGHMLANALLCPDLSDAPRTYKKVTFYLDTPILVRVLGLEGALEKRAADELLTLLHKLGAKLATFSHSREELDHVIRGAANHIDSTNGRGAIVMEARRNRTTKSDLLLIAEKADELLDNARIRFVEYPPYAPQFQIDEIAFGAVLEDEISYFNPRAKDYDINSVRAIYVLRGNHAPRKVEDARAVLVTSNSAFARAAYQYGQKHEQSRAVSSVITDFSLANMAWLKEPLGAPSLPRIEILAFAYAAMQPSRTFLQKYLQEIDKLEKKGSITQADHQLLRSSALAQQEMMNLTLGREDALTESSIEQTLARVENEIKREAWDKLAEEQETHAQTQTKLASVQDESSKLMQRTFWKCRRMSIWIAWCISLILASAVFVGLFAGPELRLASASLAVLTFCNLVFGTFVRGLHRKIQAMSLTWLLRREVSATGVDFTQIHQLRD